MEQIMPKILQSLRKRVVKMSENFRELLLFGTSYEKKACEFLKEKFQNQIDCIQFVEYCEEDNSKQQLYGDIELKTKFGRTIHFEVKSRRKETDCLCFEINEKKELKPKFVDYYLFFLPNRKPLMLDYFTFYAIYPKLAQDKPIRHVSDGEAVIFIPIIEVIQEFEKLTGLSGVA